MKPGWLERQYVKVSEDIEQWPEWMKREAGFTMEDNKSGCQELFVAIRNGLSTSGDAWAYLETANAALGEMETRVIELKSMLATLMTYDGQSSFDEEYRCAWCDAYKPIHKETCFLLKVKCALEGHTTHANVSRRP